MRQQDDRTVGQQAPVCRPRGFRNVSAYSDMSGASLACPSARIRRRFRDQNKRFERRREPGAGACRERQHADGCARGQLIGGEGKSPWCQHRQPIAVVIGEPAILTVQQRRGDVDRRFPGSMPCTRTSAAGGEHGQSVPARRPATAHPPSAATAGSGQPADHGATHRTRRPAATGHAAARYPRLALAKPSTAALTPPALVPDNTSTLAVTSTRSSNCPYRSRTRRARLPSCGAAGGGTGT